MQSLNNLNYGSDAKGIRSSTDHVEDLKNLQAQLAHCEADLQANIDLVATLEAALNDSERNVSLFPLFRKSLSLTNMSLRSFVNHGFN